MPEIQIDIVKCDLSIPYHQDDLLELMKHYALDPMSGGHTLSTEAKLHLIPHLKRHPAFYGWMAYYEDNPVGFAICFLTFSTFAGLPAMNIHDISVRNGFRSQKLGRRLLEVIESKAKELDCCKLTLEVREDNEPARGLYRKFNFNRMVVGEQGKPMEFWEKHILSR